MIRGIQKVSEAHPFLKWAGGKTQLLEQMSSFLPENLKNGGITEYSEPFVGGGAVFFYIIKHYPVKKAHLFDINGELILAYTVIQRNVEDLISRLITLADSFFSLSTEERKHFYYEQRNSYNRDRTNMNFKAYSRRWIQRAAQMLFLNRTCYNGLFRVNLSGEFNVPFGDYKKPCICDKANLRNVSKVLQGVEIRRIDFAEILTYATPGSFVYFDPPYRPISKTSRFTSYSDFCFNDEQQKRLAEVFKELDKKGVKLLLSNSDPKNENPDDDFFEHLYRGYRIERISANRMINSVGSKRGQISELLIMNY